MTVLFLFFVLLFYHDTVIFTSNRPFWYISIFHKVPFCQNPYSYFTLILFVSLSYVICFMPVRLLSNLWGLMLLYRFTTREVAAPNQWNIQIISIFFSTCHNLSRKERSCVLEAILAVLMVYIIRIDESNQIGISSPPTIPFFSILIMYSPRSNDLKKKKFPLWYYEKIFIVPKCNFSHIVYIDVDTYRKPQSLASTP